MPELQGVSGGDKSRTMSPTLSSLLFASVAESSTVPVANCSAHARWRRARRCSSISTAKNALSS